jgi:hypothetical protein
MIYIKDNKLSKRKNLEALDGEENSKNPKRQEQTK